MKKIFVIFILIPIVFFIGCSFESSQYINFKSKPSPYYYTEELKKDLNSTNGFSLIVFDTNFYKEIIVEDYDKKAFKDFIKAIKDDNFIDETMDSNKKCVFKVYVTIDDVKYLLKVFEGDYISIAPWDGVFKEDVLNESTIPQGNKLDTFCKYILDKK